MHRARLGASTTAGERRAPELDPAREERPDQPRKQLVRVQAIGVSDVFISISSLVGPYAATVRRRDG